MFENIINKLREASENQNTSKNISQKETQSKSSVFLNNNTTEESTSAGILNLIKNQNEDDSLAVDIAEVYKQMELSKEAEEEQNTEEDKETADPTAKTETTDVQEQNINISTNYDSSMQVLSIINEQLSNIPEGSDSIVYEENGIKYEISRENDGKEVNCHITYPDNSTLDNKYEKKRGENEIIPRFSTYTYANGESITTRYAYLGDKAVEVNVKNEKYHGENYNVNPTNHATLRHKESFTLGNVTPTEPDINTKDGVISNSQQNRVGDCWLLSGINALNYTDAGKDYYKDLFEYHDGYTVVHFKGGAGDYIVTDEEIKTLREQGKLANGDMDVNIIELAVQKYIDDYADGKLIFTSSVGYVSQYHDKTNADEQSINGGYSERLLYLITGKLSESIDNKNNGENFDEYLDRFQSGELVEIGAYINREGKDPLYDINGNDIFSLGAHAFAVKNVDDDTVTIVNPWDSSIEYTISREEFKNKVYQMQVCDLSENNPEIKAIARYDNATVNIGGTDFTAEIIDQQSNDISRMTILDNDSNYGIELFPNGKISIIYRNENTGMYDMYYDITDPNFNYEEILKNGELKDYIESLDFNEYNKTYQYREGEKILVHSKDKDGNEIDYTYDELNRCVVQEITTPSGEKKKIERDYSGSNDTYYTQHEYTYDETKGDYILKSSAQYDTSYCTKPISKTEYLDDGTVINENYEYMVNNTEYKVRKHTREVVYTNGKSKIETMIYKANTEYKKTDEYETVNGEKLLMRTIGADGKVLVNNTYDSDNRLIYQDIINSDGKHQRNEMEYSDDGLLYEAQNYIYDEATDEYYLESITNNYTYEEVNGKKIVKAAHIDYADNRGYAEETYEYQESELTHTTRKEYNSSGELEREVKIEYSAARGATFEIVYDKEGNKIKRTIIYNDGTREITEF